ncbi:hypothetical protein PO124_24975 [Bacillus licheniformis]|nr:hypothetical protein [Bacillus licheniformis]
MWKESLDGERVDLILDSIGPATLQIISMSLNRTEGSSFRCQLWRKYPASAALALFPQISIIGTSMGSLEEFRQMIDLSNAIPLSR